MMKISRVGTKKKKKGLLGFILVSTFHENGKKTGDPELSFN